MLEEGAYFELRADFFPPTLFCFASTNKLNTARELWVLNCFWHKQKQVPLLFCSLFVLEVD